MANQAVVEILLNAKDKASENLERTEGALSSLGAAGKVAVGGIAAAGAAMAAAAGAALNFSTDVDKAMRQVQAQTGMTQSELDNFESTAMQVFQAGWGESVQQIARGMREVRRATGQTGDELEASTKRALTLAKTFGVDVTEAATLAETALDAGLVQTSEEGFDMLTTGFQEGLNRAEDFTDTVREYSSDFSRAGFNAKEFLNTLNAGLEAGARNTDIVADGVREFGIRFSGAEDSAVEAMQNIGIDTEGLYAKFRAGEITTKEAFQTVTSQLAQVEDKTLRAQAGAALMGSQWEDAGADVFLAAGQAAGGIEEVAGRTDEAGQVMQEGLGPAVRRMKRTFLVSMKPIGDAIGRVLTILVENLGPGLTKTMENIAPYIARFAAMLSERLPQAIGWLQQTWERVWPAVQEALQKAWDVVRPILDRVQSWFQSEGPSAMSTLERIWKRVLNEVVPLFEEQLGWIISWVEENWPLIQETVSVTLNRIRTIVGAVLGFISRFWSNHGDAIMKIVGYLWDSVKTIIETTLKVVFGVIKAVMQAITGDWKGAWETIKGVVGTLWEGIKQLIGNTLNIIKTTIFEILGATELSWKEIWGRIKGFVSGIWDSIRDVVDRGIDRVLGIVEGLISDIKSAFDIDWAAIGRSIVEGIKSGLNSLKDELLGTAGGLASGAKQRMKNLLGIGCPEPSPIFAELGAAMGEGVLAGLAQMQPRIRKRLGAVVEPPRLRGVPTQETKRPARQVTDNRRYVRQDTYIIRDRTAMAMLLREKRDRALREATGGV